MIKKFYSDCLGFKVFLVNEEEIRNTIDVKFYDAGHHLFYSYIPDNEIWIEQGYDQSEIQALFIHEYTENKLMRQGQSYDNAHKVATEKEENFRQQKKENQDLTVEDFMKNISMAGKRKLLRKKRAGKNIKMKYISKSTGKIFKSKAAAAAYHRGAGWATGGRCNDKISIHLSEMVTIDNEKWYKVLSIGEIHSMKYNGIWDANPDIYFNEEKSGVIEVHENFIDALLNNFKINANETALFVDIDHDRGISAGPIQDMKKDIYQKTGKTSLFVKPVWNDIGVDSISNKHYMYLSMGVTSHKNSKTGDIIFPVMQTVSLTNLPVDKDQDIIELSDISKSTDKKIEMANNKSKSKKGGSSMDELIAMFQEFMTKAQAQIESDDTGATKAAIGAMLDNAEETLGTEDEETDEAPETDEMKDKSAVAPATQQPTNPPQGVKMSESEIALSEKIIKLETELNEQKRNLKLKDFSVKYLNKKFLKANESKWQSLFLKDEKSVIELLDSVKDMELTVEKGSSNDLKLNEIKGDKKKVKEAFDVHVQAIMASEKCDVDAALSKVRLTEPDLYKLGIEANIPSRREA